MKKLNLNISLMSTYVAMLVITIAALAFIKEFDIAYPLRVSTAYPSTELTVVGEGKVDVVPDTATITAGITVSNEKTVEAAEAKINEANNKIVAAMKDLGIDSKDIQTSNYSINPSYSFDQVQRIEGYGGDATVTVKTHKMDQVSDIVGKLTEAGANQVHGVQFSIDDMSKFRVEARNKAIEDAKSQAEELADQLGLRLGKVTNIVETADGGAPMPYMSKSFEARDLAVAEQSAEFEPGSQTVTSTVTLFFEKK